ncbi:MAG TPA: type IX secretion system membrane protein PorP/SprF [Flavobacteriales bacterium]|nr:type IX secretion system membrane protein PorP/SprF [Flavobacteriales bacterium]HIB77807.1 type IX secretion system membrane protein PorP/SprF [Flavobacteriales bacterium]HIN41375.1 type IX secretion system membrane protein PorP/SprF [Flavobacteriales bacterium]HIO15488.1 type IX secretion system membrane protein PorP/SprF [Flavobacteriales bacterium]
MHRIVIASIWMFILAAPLNAQQRFRRTAFPVNSFLVNPAVAGTEPVTVFGSSYRHQWAGFDGAPTTMVFSAHSSSPSQIGGGIIVYKDDMGGAVTQTGVELTGSYQLRLPNTDAVSFGLSLQGTQFGFDSSNLNVWDQDDPALTGGMETTFGIDASTGMMIYGADYSFGLAVSNLFQDKLGLTGVEEDFNKHIRHYRFMGSYTTDISNKFSVQTSGMIRLTEVTPAQVDIYSRAIYKYYQGLYWGGLGLRMGDAITFSAGVEFSSIGIAYTYDITTGDNLLSPYSHEVNLTYLLPHKKGFGQGSLGPRRILERNRLVK